METTERKIIIEDRQGEATLLKQAPKTYNKYAYIESYGCQMNFSDSEIVASILNKEDYGITKNFDEANLILINTCSIRDKAEQTVRNRLVHFNGIKKRKKGLIIGIMGCMAERLKADLLEEEKIVDLIVGPDAYRDLPSLIKEVTGGQKAVNVLLSREETYSEISPIRLNSNGVTAFVSIMRGCDNMCSFCVVPFTRGRERSRDPETIVHEAKYLYQEGIREITLLGQNVDSYRWNITAKGEIKDTNKETVNFSQLLEKVAIANPKLRIRFSTSHPKDMTDDVLRVIAKYDNICNFIHLPVQSGNSEILKKMNRGYTREWYLDRIRAINEIIPGCTISSDIITGFCGETEEQHNDTLTLIEEVKFTFVFNYKYSERPKTLAERKFEDDVPEEVKSRRLTEIINVVNKNALNSNQNDIGKTFEVLVEGVSKKSDQQYHGRNDQNKMVIFDKEDSIIGDYVNVKIHDCSSATLKGKIIS